MAKTSPFRDGSWFQEKSNDLELDPTEVLESTLEDTLENPDEPDKAEPGARQFRQLARSFQADPNETEPTLKSVGAAAFAPQETAQDDAARAGEVDVPEEASSAQAVLPDLPAVDIPEFAGTPKEDAKASPAGDGDKAVLAKHETPSIGRRARERAQRKRDILDCARGLFAERGFQGCTMEDICTRTEFAKPTLYKYFSSKEDLFYTVLMDGYGDLEAILRGSRKKARVTDQFRNVCVMFLIYFRKHLDFFQIHRQVSDRLKREATVPMQKEAQEALGRIQEGMEDMFRDGLMLGEFRPMDPKKTCLIFFEALSVYTYAFREEKELRTAHEMADEVLMLFLDGLKLSAI